MDYEKEALKYHANFPAGKIAITVTKPLDTKEDLSLAYSPGVAGPCREIAKDEDLSFKYTNRGNLVGVISNGTAVLGLGNIGPYAGKPVMEGKAMLFKKFANIDVFDINVAAEDPDQFIAAVKALEPTFGGINLEDIKAPECFYIEEQLKKQMKIPVFHDDQHGTAIIGGAAFLNALEITNRKIEEVKIVFSGAGAAALACAKLFMTLGIQKHNMILCDRVGVISTSRTDLNEYKARFAAETNKVTLADALKGADAFVGVSGPNLVTKEMVLSMADNPIIFALANPDPEITPPEVKAIRPDAIMATGRSDYPNQVNNVLGFPYIFRGALDVRAKTVNEEMKLAAVRAIAELAKEPVPEEVMAVYKESGTYTFGKDYLIPKPVDQRVLLKVAPAVAKAAMDSGVARIHIDIEEYKLQIEKILGPTRQMIRKLRQNINKVSIEAKKRPVVVLPNAHKIRVLKAAKQVGDEGEVDIVLLGSKEMIEQKMQEAKIKNLGDHIKIIDPHYSEMRDELANDFFKLRQRKGVTKSTAWNQLSDHYYFASMLLKNKLVDGLVGGYNRPYSTSVRPVLEIIGACKDKALAGVYMVACKGKTFIFSDCTININPDADQLVKIALASAEVAKEYIKENIRVAMLSYSSFGTNDHPEGRKVREAVAKMRQMKDLGFEVDGEMQIDIALDAELRKEEAPFAELTGNANVLIFPNLAAANIAYKLISNMGDAVVTGPILVGLSQPANIVQRGASVSEIVNMIYVTADQAVKCKK